MPTKEEEEFTAEECPCCERERVLAFTATTDEGFIVYGCSEQCANSEADSWNHAISDWESAHGGGTLGNVGAPWE